MTVRSRSLSGCRAGLRLRVGKAVAQPLGRALFLSNENALPNGRATAPFHGRLRVSRAMTATKSAEPMMDQIMGKLVVPI